MAEPTPFAGTIEILYPDGTNQGVAGRAYTAANVPLLLGMVWGFTDIMAIDPPAYGAPNVPADLAGQWTATTPDHDTVTVLLHQEPAFADTMIGQIIVNRLKELV